MYYSLKNYVVFQTIAYLSRKAHFAESVQYHQRDPYGGESSHAPSDTHGPCREEVLGLGWPFVVEFRVVYNTHDKDTLQDKIHLTI